ncbi:hypothetical protein ACPFL9_01835 [Paenarthrobacter sp. NyZ202]|uniref:hypothetical protein n=1 Tax=Paenarthrobacter sp. NyZ202 TaxID=3402689 RepID=UPI003CF37B82
MKADKRRKESLATGSDSRSGKHKLPDPPDPDNLPIDYTNGWDSSRFPTSAPRSLRPQHLGHRRNNKP